MNRQKEAISKAPSGRTRRAPLSRKNILTVEGKEPGYKYRIVNDSEDRIAELMERGYEIVNKSRIGSIGDKRVESASSEGSVATVTVDRRLGLKGVVMRQREDWYEEDQRDKQAYIDAVERSTKEEARKGHYGRLDSEYN